MTASDLVKKYRRTLKLEVVLVALTNEVSDKVMKSRGPRDVVGIWREAESKWNKFAKIVKVDASIFPTFVFSRIPRLKEIYDAESVHAN